MPPEVQLFTSAVLSEFLGDLRALQQAQSPSSTKHDQGQTCGKREVWLRHLLEKSFFADMLFCCFHAICHESPQL